MMTGKPLRVVSYDYDELFFGVTPEGKAWILKQFEAARPKVESVKGHVLIMGTTGGCHSQGLEKLFNTPDGFEHVELPPSGLGYFTPHNQEENQQP